MTMTSSWSEMAKKFQTALTAGHPQIFDVSQMPFDGKAFKTRSDASKHRIAQQGAEGKHGLF
jgi:hypothetical protein